MTLSWDLQLLAPPSIPEAEAGWLDGLWEHDVVEFFLRGSSPTPYLELEFGPGGHWLALSFDEVRQRSAELRDLVPADLSNEVTDKRWRGRAALPVAVIERVAGARPWHGMACAVLGRGPGSERAHLSWPTLEGQPLDFHCPDRWAPLLPGVGPSLS
ncbi:MAG: hypothetical protein AAF533_09910 [Acidobacteriota bacterium]